MLKFYFNGSPNPTKVALFLEEAGLPYEAIPVDTRKGEQFTPAFLAVNPNGKVPAIVDGDAAVFDSNAILLYLAEKTGKFLPPNARRARRAAVVADVRGHRRRPVLRPGRALPALAPEKVAYAHTRYQYEAERHYGILDARLAKQRYMVGDTYTIVDMDVWGWARMVPFIMRREAWAKCPTSSGCVDEISARPRRPRGRAEGQAHLQDRDGRRGARRTCSST